MRKLIEGSRVPKRVQIEDALREAIDSGEFPPGSPIPSRSALVEHFGVAYATIRQGIAKLEEQHVLVGKHGRGVFVADNYAPPGADVFEPVDLNGVLVYECVPCGSLVMPGRRARHLGWHTRINSTG